MFDKEYSFKGTHAEKVNKLTAKFDDKNQLAPRPTRPRNWCS